MRRKFILITMVAMLAAAMPPIQRAGSQKDGQADVLNTDDSSWRDPLAGEPDRAENSSHTVRLKTRLVNATLTVADRAGQCISGLTKNNFSVFDNGVEQEITHFSDYDAPITVGIIYDVSGSMKDLTGASFQSLKTFFAVSHEDDEYFVIAFHDRPILVQDFTISPAEIMNRVVSIKATGSTALYDAVAMGVEKAKQGRHGRKALLIISDGLDNNSRYNGADLRELVQEGDVAIYSIGLRELSIGAVNLKNLSEWSGGRAFFPVDQARTFDVYAQIANMLRRQYVMGFYPSDATGSIRHKLRIHVKASPSLGPLSLFYKKGYESFR